VRLFTPWTDATPDCLAVNLLLTLLISVRLYMMSKYVREALGAAHAHAYTSVAAIVAESAFP
jgi:hypothetical protein